MLQYTDPRSCAERYQGSVILNKGAPWYVIEVRNPGDEVASLDGLFCRDEKVRTRVKANSPDLFDRPFRLGYVNGLNVEGKDLRGAERVYVGASYAQRIPVRKWKQGLDSVNLKFLGAGMGRAGWERTVLTKGFDAMIRNDYPSYEEAIKNITDNRETVLEMAFDKRLSVKWINLEQFVLNFRGNMVARSDDPFKPFKLLEPYQYLRELLDEKGLKVA